jgi:hypothetical protein
MAEKKPLTDLAIISWILGVLRYLALMSQLPLSASISYRYRA